MAYYLMVEEKKGKYLPIDITKSSLFTRMSNLTGMGSNIQEIDYFTVNFNDYNELSNYLVKEGLLNANMVDKPLSIRHKKNNEYKKVMYDFIYQKDIEYLINPKKILDKINNKLLKRDFLFVLKYAQFFMNTRDCSSTAPEIRDYINRSISNNKIDEYFYYKDSNYDNPLERMTKLLIYDYYQDINGKITYYSKVKYRNLHMIIAFINHYEEKNKSLVQEDNKQVNEVKKRVKTKTSKEVVGQIGLFD